MKFRTHLVAGLAVLACSSLTDTGDGVVAIELQVPANPAVEPRDTLTLSARALDKNGDVVNVPIIWSTPNPTLLIITDPAGKVTTDSVTGTGQMQAHVGSLLSPLVTLTVHASSDTLALAGPDTMTVLDADTASAALKAVVQALNPPAGVVGTAISYVVRDSLTNKGLVHFQGGGVTLRATTGIDGLPVTDVTLRRTSGAVQPDSAIVDVFAFRPSQDTVPGSGQHFVVRFE